MGLKVKELENLSKEDLESQVVDLKQELAKEKSTIASGTRSENPGKIKKLRRDIARILTALQAKKLKENANARN
jgi:large subunit ribosomal protein L29